MRAIIRFSIDKEKDGALRNKLLKVLRTSGFHRRKNTATYETASATEGDLRDAFHAFWDIADKHSGPGHPGRLDHFWIYADRGATDNPSN